MHCTWLTLSAETIHSQTTGRFQHALSTEQTTSISEEALGPLATTFTLSLDCERLTTLPCAVFQNGMGVC